MDGLSIGLQITMLLFFSLFGYIIAMKIHQSAVVGVIIIGIIIGPSIFNFIQYTEFVEALAHIGAIVLLFAIGLEFKLREVYTIKYTITALGGVIVPLILGYFLGIAFGYSFAQSILIGTALTATSIAITASVLLEMGKLNTPAGKAIIGAAVVDDVLGLIVLSITLQLAQGNIDISNGAVAAIKALLFIGIGIFIANYLRNIFIKLDEKEIAKKFPDFMFILVMMFAFFYSFLAEFIGLSGIVGAFIAGSTLAGIKFKNSKDLAEGAEYMHIIFAAIFFISLGILADMRNLSFEVIIFIIALVFVATISKIIGCSLPSKFFGMSKKDALTVGTGMIPRGEVGMIVGLLGLTSGILTQSIYVSLIAMSIITTIITPFMLRKIFK